VTIRIIYSEYLGRTHKISADHLSSSFFPVVVPLLHPTAQIVSIHAFTLGTSLTRNPV
jgi:hypothetical protein